MRLLHGERVYRDFFQFTAPGTDFFCLSLFRIFGANSWVTDLAVILVGAALCWGCFDLASQLMDRGWALLSTGLYLVFIYGKLLDATHHWFSLLAVACPIRILLPERTAARIVAAEILLGIASFFTQTSGAAGLLGLLLVLPWECNSARGPRGRLMHRELALLMCFS
jgi:hypothetical protein